MTSPRTLLGALAAVMAGPTDACGAEAGAVSFEAIYTADVIAPLRGAPFGGRYLDNLDVILDVDLEKAAGWKGAKLHLYGLNNSGAEPNDRLGTLQGVDNIEVSRPRARLYEAWIEQDLGRGVSVLAGLYDLNSEFYATASSDLLIAPPFGIGSELAATGANGPSIFPSTAPTVRVRAEVGEHGYIQAAVLNAEAYTLGDPGGLRDFDGGVLTIAEASFGEATRLALGAWRYSDRTDDLRRVRPDGSPEQARAQGAYVLAEHKLSGPVTLFARGGLSDGDTGPFRGSWQAGFLMSPAFKSRPDSAVSVGAHQGFISRGFRDNEADAGRRIGATETGLELTYSDRVAPRLMVQPNLQYVRRPGGDRDARDAIVGGVRFVLDLTP
jgi:porin